MNKVVRPLDYYLDLIATGWPEFKDDGLSGGFPDWVYRHRRLHLAGRVHDWHYCSRCHPPEQMDQEHRTFADLALRVHARELLPWYMWLAPLVLYWGVRVGGGTSAWDSCGPGEGERCRHNVQRPSWMTYTYL